MRLLRASTVFSRTHRVSIRKQTTRSARGVSSFGPGGRCIGTERLVSRRSSPWPIKTISCSMCSAAETRSPAGPSWARRFGICETAWHSFPLDPAEILKTLTQQIESRRSIYVHTAAPVSWMQESHPRHRPGRLRLGDEGRGERAHCSHEECSSIHYSITWSARCKSDGGMVRPRALAVLRLMTSSNLVGCSTGRSAGLAPLRILST